MSLKLVRSKTCLWGKLKSLQQSLNEEREKSDKVDETIQVPQKYLKLSKAAQKLEENLTCLHSDIFEINTGKLQGVTVDSGCSSLKKVKVSIIQHKR